MEKKYIVRLNDQERDQLELVIEKLSGYTTYNLIVTSCGARRVLSLI